MSEPAETLKSEVGEVAKPAEEPSGAPSAAALHVFSSQRPQRVYTRRLGGLRIDAGQRARSQRLVVRLESLLELALAEKHVAEQLLRERGASRRTQRRLQRGHLT